jgi:hypothetical protein
MPVDGLIGQVRGEREKEKECGQYQAGAAEKPVPSEPPNRACGVGRLRLSLRYARSSLSAARPVTVPR